jgi:hypothetical protein
MMTEGSGSGRPKNMWIRNIANKLLAFLTNVTKLFLVLRWGRPPLPELDAAKDALIFQQLELDHYIGELP